MMQKPDSFADADIYIYTYINAYACTCVYSACTYINKNTNFLNYRNAYIHIDM